jgi:hypothetical protein
LIWHAVIWLLWRTRNEKNIQDKGNNVLELMDKIKRTSWEWLLAKKANAPCMYYETMSAMLIPLIVLFSIFIFGRGGVPYFLFGEPC